MNLSVLQYLVTAASMVLHRILTTIDNADWLEPDEEMTR
jgi:hypothetical protein